MKCKHTLLSNHSFFIAGTDTGVGKTTVTCLLLDLFAKQGLSTLGLKPIATGCHQTPDGRRNHDALLLQHHSTLKLPYHQINPLALTDPASPNIAAKNQSLSMTQIIQSCQPALTAPTDKLLVEGAGGWKVPINDSETMADLAKALTMPVILVVGIRLGCINHTLLTVESIQKMRVPLAGWIANTLEPDYPFQKENQHTISHYLSAPLLAEIPFGIQP